jgi:mxaA protein
MAVIPVRTIDQPSTTRGGSFVAACAASVGAVLALSAIALPYSTAQGQTAAQQPVITVSVRQPRAFGHVIGDELEQRISLLAPAGFALDLRSLPRPGRTGLWLELAPPRLTTDRAGDATRYRLVLDYRIINAPEQVRTVELPELDLLFGPRGGQVSASIDEWPITIAPITPTFVLARAGLQQMQPDAGPAMPDAGRYGWLTLLWAAALVALLAGRALRRRGIPWLRQGTRPFAHAARDIAKLARLPPDRSTYRRALQRLHRAFDVAAGHAIFGERLAPLFAARAELLPLRAEIEQFYAASQREFFGLRADPPSVDDVLTLARRCRDAEGAAARRPSSGGGPAASDRRVHAV